jgi:alpha-beta hydrolase superfamily lysophospholipase
MKRAAALLLIIFLASCAFGTAGTAEPVDPMKSAGDALVMKDGAKLALRSWLPDGEARAAIVALHGINDYGGAYAIPGSYLVGRGIAVYAFDQRGFGASAERGLWPGANALTGDAREAVRLIGERHPGLPLYLLGESMGGAVAILAAAEGKTPRLDGLILVAPAVWGGKHFSRIFRAALGVGDRVAPGLALSGRLSGVTLSDNREMLAAMRKDPLFIQKSRIDSLDGVVELMDLALEDSSALDLPVLLLYGLKDEVVPKDALCDFMTRPKKPPAAAFYPEGYHLLLRDRQREKVLGDIVSWINDPDEPLPSGFGHDCR